MTSPAVSQGIPIGTTTQMAGGGGGSGSTTPYPKNATPVVAAPGPGANAAVNATIPAVAGRLAYISGFEMTAGGSTAGSVVEGVVQGVAPGNMVYAFTVPTVASGIAAQLIVEFNPPLPASAVNTAILVGLPALGSGNSVTGIVAHGYYI